MPQLITVSACGSSGSAGFAQALYLNFEISPCDKSQLRVTNMNSSMSRLACFDCFGVFH